MTATRVLRVGTRKSLLARTQTQHVVDALRAAAGDVGPSPASVEVLSLIVVPCPDRAVVIPFAPVSRPRRRGRRRR